MSTFVSVGNAQQPFTRLLDEVARISPQLPQPVLVQHGHTPFAAAGCVAVDFLDPARYAEQIRTARVLVLHAGAGSVLHAIESGHVPVVVPRLARFGEHVNDHQLAFARQLAQAGRVLLVEEAAQLAAAVPRVPERRAFAGGSTGGALVAEVRRLLEAHERRLGTNQPHSRTS